MLLTIPSHAVPDMWRRGWKMLSPFVQRLVGTAAAAICTLAVAAIIGGVVMYGDVRALHERLDTTKEGLAAIRADNQILHGRMTEHLRNHER